MPSGEKISPSETDCGGEASVDKNEILRRFSFEYPEEHLTRIPEKTSVSVLYPRVLDGADEEVHPKRSGGKRRLPAFLDGGAFEESAKRGIATHMFMQFFDPTLLERNGVNAELDRLKADGFLSASDRERVRAREIEAFARSEMFFAMKSAKKLYREMRFNARLPAVHFSEDSSLREKLLGETVLVQGVIDCIIECEDGSLRLVDYKTDRLSRGELADRKLAEQTLTAKHSQQLEYYAMAIEKIFGKAPVSKEIYSLHLGDTVKIP